MARTLTIATRESRLALWQAEFVRAHLLALHPGLCVELRGMRTEGDRFLDAPLAAAGGKGLFVKELERALLDRRADIAVHSMKDVPVELPATLRIPVVLAREDPRDAYLSMRYPSLQSLPAGAVVGTSSLRRRSQLRHQRADLRFIDLRGNVDTRLRKLEAGGFDAIVLAAAGLKRLGLSAPEQCLLDADEVIPAIGQGAIGIECRQADAEVLALIAPLNDPVTAACVTAERALNAALQGGCQLPIAGHGVCRDGRIRLTAMVADAEGTRLIRDAIEGVSEAAPELGAELGQRLLRRGAAELINAMTQAS